MLLHLSRSTSGHPGKRYIVELLDQFEHVGPNGTHLCLVLPFMVTDGLDIVMSFKAPHPEYVRSVSEQLTLGLDFLHAEGIIHCGNFAPSKSQRILLTRNRFVSWKHHVLNHRTYGK